jgi:uncharacterized protein (AIM24 family)
MTTETVYEIQHAPAYAALTLKLQANQTVLVESGAMAAMDSHQSAGRLDERTGANAGWRVAIC